MNPLEKTTGPCIILAGAGTGKTHTIVEKIKYLIDNKIYSPERIVCITFSNEAANNLLARVQKALPVENNKEPIIKTFHAFSADLIRKYGDKIGINPEFSILDTNEAKIVLHRNFKVSSYNCHKYVSSIGTAKDLGISLEELKSYLNKKMESFKDLDLEKILENLQFQLQTLYLKKEKEKKKDISEQIKKVSSLVELKKFITSWESYEKIKNKRNYQDYSDLNKNALHLLKSFPQITNDFDYIIVDEFQDTNKIQLDLLVALAPNRNITIVGDLNQSIYRFRGAYKENFTLFKKHFNVSSQDIFNLDKSHRSSNKILRLAHQLILNNYQNKEECFKVENFESREGEKINTYELKTAKEEARKVVEIIESEISSGTKPEEICVLFRTHQQARIVKIALDLKKIPYSAATQSLLLKQKSVKTVINYLTIINKLARKEKGGESAWWDLIYNSDFTEEDLIKIGKYIKENKESENISAKLLSSLNSLPLSARGIMSAKILVEKIKIMLPLAEKNTPELLKELYHASGLINKEKTKEEKEVMLNLNKFRELSLNHASLHSPDLSTFLNYLDIIESLGIEIEASRLESSGIRLMTLHATKGLEYKTVIITNMAQKRFPMEKVASNTLIPIEIYPELKEINLPEEDFIQYVKEYELKNQLLEERRLCYVAFTRAKENLFLTYSQDYANKKHYPSQFLNEITYKTNPDISFQVDAEEKYLDPRTMTQPTLSFDFALNSSAFENILTTLAKKSDKNAEKTLPENMHFSPSSLLSFLECQKKYEYQYIYNMPEKKTLSWEAIRLGSFVHQILEIGVKRNLKELKYFLDLAKEIHLKEDWQSVELDSALHLIKVFFERNKEKYNENSKTEQLLKAKIGEFSFIGFADRIDFYDDGLEIIDYKTGKTNIAPRHRNWQLGFYALAAKKLGLGKVKKVTLDMLKLEKPLEFALDNQGNAVCTNANMEFNIFEVEDELIKAAKQITNAYKNGFKPCPIEKNCDFCNEYVYGF